MDPRVRCDEGVNRFILAPDDVNPLVGTRGVGHTFPGAAFPFGMVNPSPRTPSRVVGGDYAFDDTAIEGFSMVHLSGPGRAALGHLTAMVVPAAAGEGTPGARPASFSHDREVATPGHYTVELDELARVELAATERLGWLGFAPIGAGQRAVVLDLGDGQVPSIDASLRVVDEHTVVGHQSNAPFGDDRAYCGGDGRLTLHFALRSSVPLGAARLWADDAWLVPDAIEATGRTCGLAVDLADGCRWAIAVSWVDVEGALANLDAGLAEVGVDGLPTGADLARAAELARDAWSRELGRVAVQGANPDDRVVQATALYHALLHPSLASDVDGRYRGGDRRVHRADHRVLTHFSLWDAVRTHQPLLALLRPDVAREVALSLRDHVLETGQAPRWVLGGVETNVMSGDPGAQFFAHALALGSLTADELAPVFPALLAAATAPAAQGSRAVGRIGIEHHLAHGHPAFDPDDDHGCCSASAGLEWSIADAALARIADAIGDPDAARRVRAQAARYPSGFDQETLCFRPRLSDGQWLSPFEPDRVTAPWLDRRGFEEGSALQYRWLVPHDIPGLVELLGGRKRTLALLDDYFDREAVTADPCSARSRWGDGAHHAAWNEHDMQAPWTYAALGEPGASAAVLRAQVRAFHGTGPDGLPDNDDLGALSAWLLLASWGLYAYAPGAGDWLLAPPLFERVELTPSRGEPIIIERTGTGDAVTGLDRDGEAWAQAWLGHDELRATRRICWSMGAEAGAGFDDYPSQLGSTGPVVRG